MSEYRLPQYNVDLRFTEEDVRAFGTLLRRAGYPKGNGRVVSQWTEEFHPSLAPTAANIRDHLRALARHCVSEDTVTVMLTGSGVRYGEPADWCFLPAGADLSDPRTLLTLGELRGLLGECKARRKFLFVDACQHTPEPGQLRGVTVPKLPPAGPPPEGLAEFFACSPGEDTYELETIRHGVFTHALLAALSDEGDADGDGVVTIGELYAAAKATVRRVCRQAKLPESHPLLDGTLPGTTPFLELRTLAAEPAAGTAAGFSTAPNMIGD
jgi:uncharacterized caspase-like protein